MSDISIDFDHRDSTLTSSMSLEAASCRQDKSSEFEFDIFLNQESSDFPSVTFIDISLASPAELESKNIIDEKQSIRMDLTTTQLSRKEEKNPLLLFTDNPDVKMKVSKRKDKQQIRKHPKKSYYRMKIVRNFVKELGNIYFPRKNQVDSMIVGDLQEYAKKYEGCIRKFIEGKKLSFKRSSGNSGTGSVQMNDAFFNDFFSDFIVKEGFQIFVHNYFKDSIESLSKHLGFACCKETLHLSACKEKWLVLEIWTKAGFQNTQVDM
jgi:hypothetical protein